MTIPIHSINHITFSVSSLEKSVRFYQQVFGATLLMQGKYMAYLDLGGLWLALNVQADIPRQEIKQSYTHLAFTLAFEDLLAMEQRLNLLGVSLRPGRKRDEGEGQSLYFADPDGHLLEFHTGDLKTRLEAYQNAEDVVLFPPQEQHADGK